MSSPHQHSHGRQAPSWSKGAHGRPPGSPHHEGLHQCSCLCSREESKAIGSVPLLSQGNFFFSHSGSWIKSCVGLISYGIALRNEIIVFQETSLIRRKLLVSARKINGLLDVSQDVCSIFMKSKRGVNKPIFKKLPDEIHGWTLHGLCPCGAFTGHGLRREVRTEEGRQGAGRAGRWHQDAASWQHGPPSPPHPRLGRDRGREDHKSTSCTSEFILPKFFLHTCALSDIIYRALNNFWIT